MLLYLGPEAYLPDANNMLALSCLFLLLGLLVFVSSIVQDLANRRHCLTGHLDQVQPMFPCHLEGPKEGDSPHFPPPRPDEEDLPGHDLLVYWKLFNYLSLPLLKKRLDYITVFGPTSKGGNQVVEAHGVFHQVQGLLGLLPGFPAPSLQDPLHQPFPLGILPPPLPDRLQELVQGPGESPFHHHIPHPPLSIERFQLLHLPLAE